MDPATILADVQLALQVGKIAIDLGQQAAPFLKNAYEIAFENKVLTAEERQQLRQQADDMRASIDAIIAKDDADATGDTTGV